MSRISKAVEKVNSKNSWQQKVVNFMGGTSYTLNPLDRLKMIAASSIFGEPSYYRKGGLKETAVVGYTETVDGLVPLFRELTSIMKTTTEVFEIAIDEALEFDFTGTLNLAVELRTDYNMRLNPQVIMVRAAIHPDRVEWSKKNHGLFMKRNLAVMQRADEPAVQIAYFIYVTGSKKNMPSILKRSIAARLSTLTTYEINKYKNAEIGMINAVRICHAQSETIDELMRTGTVQVEETQQTWENLLSAGMSWRDLALKMYAGEIKMPAMAFLRNLRNIFTGLEDEPTQEMIEWFCDKLKRDVPYAKQFPFRYKSAYDAIAESNINFRVKGPLLEALQDCIDMSIDNMPHLKGVTVCLTDNSGSAWGAFTSEYGSVRIANIDNLSSVIAAKCSDMGMVVKFGDRYIEFPISKHDHVLTQVKPIDANGDDDVGGATEGGIWKFLKKAIDEKIFIDNLFIFSDQQAGLGRLYGTAQDIEEYADKFGIDHNYVRPMIDVYGMIQAYRKAVNPKLNVFSVQTAGYSNLVIPTMTYRCAMLAGWTGKEVSFAAEYIKQWDEIESRNNKPNQ